MADTPPTTPSPSPSSGREATLPKDTVRASVEALRLLGPLTDAIAELGSNRNVEKGAENFYRIGKALGDFSDLNLSGLTRNVKDIDFIKEVISKLSDAISVKDLSTFQPKAALFGVAISNISKGLDSFSKLNLKAIGSNLQDLKNTSNLVDELVLNFTSSFISEQFAKDAENFGNPLSTISYGLKSFESLDFQGIKNNFLQLKEMPQLVDSIIYGLAPTKLSDTFTRAGEEFGEPLERISSGLIKFSELSFSKIVKNAFLLSIFGKTVLQALRLFPKIKLQKETAESFSHLTRISDGLISFANIKFGSLLKNVALLAVFGKSLKLLSILDGGVSLKKTAEEFGEPLGKIADALIKFSEIKWGKVLLSTVLFRTFHKLFKGTGISTSISGVSAGDKPGGKKDFYKLGLLQLLEQRKLTNLAQSFFNFWMDGDIAREAKDERMLDALEALDLEVSGGGGGGTRDSSRTEPPKPPKQKSWFEKLYDTLKGALFNAIPALLGSLAFIPAMIGSFFTTVGSQLRFVFTKLTPNLVKAFDDTMDFLKGFFSEEGAIGKVFKPIKKLFSEEGAITKLFEPVVKLFKGEGAIGSFFGKIGKFSKIFGSLGKIVGEVLGKIALPITILMGVFDGITGFIDGFKEEGILGGIKGAIVGVVDGLVGFLIDIPMKGLGYIAGWLGFDNVAEVLKTFSFKDNFQQIVDTIFDSVQDAFTWISDSISNLISGVLSGDTSSIFKAIFPLSMLLPDSVQENISEFFKEMVRSILPDPGKSFIGKLLSNVIPDSVYQWAGLNPKTGALLPSDKLNQFVEDQKDPKKSAKDIMQKRKELKSAGYTDEMIDSASEKKAEEEKKQKDDLLKEEEKKKRLQNRKDAREKTQHDKKYGKDIENYRNLVQNSNDLEEIGKSGKALKDKGLSDEELTKIFDEEQQKRNKIANFKTVIENPDVKTKQDNKNKRKIGEPVIDSTLGRLMAERQREMIAAADAQEQQGLLVSPDVKPVGKAIDVISTNNESARQDAMAAVIAPTKNNNVTNNNTSSSTTVINSNIPDRTYAAYGRNPAFGI
jgi:hypothetical protein